jgi:death on curing protein
VKSPVWIGEREALALHDRLLALHGGATGVRVEGLLRSALARPRQHYTYGDSPDTIDLAAIYTAGLVSNHPFVDGNKRTGFVVGGLFLELNGYRFHASEEDAAKAVLALDAGTLTHEEYGAFLRTNATMAKDESVLNGAGIAFRQQAMTQAAATQAETQLEIRRGRHQTLRFHAFLSWTGVGWALHSDRSVLSFLEDAPSGHRSAVYRIGRLRQWPDAGVRR